MASIRKKGNIYQVRWRDPDGIERSRTAPDRESARQLQKDIEQRISLGERWEPRDARPEADLPQILEAFARECARVLRPGTAERYARALDLFMRFLRKRGGGRGKLSPRLLSKNLLSEWYEDLATGGLHGQERGQATRRKIVEIVQLAWEWAFNDDQYGEAVPRPRRIRMPREPAEPTVAPTWKEMDACIYEATAWQKRLCIVMRFTGLRVQQVMGLVWSDFDLEHLTLRIRGELGKSKQERRGRRIPISQHLADELRGWDRPEGEDWVIVSNRFRGGDRERAARARDVGRAWKRAGVRSEAWRQPHHSFRKGFVSELKRAGADPDAVEFLVGHSLGLRGVYTDPDALPLRQAVNLIPPMTRQGRIIPLRGGRKPPPPRRRRVA